MKSGKKKSSLKDPALHRLFLSYHELNIVGKGEEVSLLQVIFAHHMYDLDLAMGSLKKQH